MTKTYTTHLECSLEGDRYEADKVHGLSMAGKPLLVRYDFQTARGEADRDAIAARPGGFFKYRELLPIRRDENVVSLGEVVTPLVEAPHTAERAGVASSNLLIKDEGRLPTGSFKARGLGLAVSMAKEFGIEHMAMPTNGNAGAALAAYAHKAGIKSTVFCPEDTPEVNVRELSVLGADTYRVNGLIHECGAIVGAGKEKAGWFDVSTLKEPYRIEGKKTMGIELAEQLGWRLPDVIFYPTGGGTGLIGMWKAFQELKTLGWLEDEAMPKMVAVQAKGCAPIVRAFIQGTEDAGVWENAETVAAGIRVPKAIGDFLILRAVRESGGFAIAVDDEAIIEARDRMAAADGTLLCPEGAATLVAWERSVRSGRIEKDARCVLFNCATGLKYPLPDASRRLDKDAPIDYAAFA